MLDVVIKGGTVVAPEGAAVMDVGIQGEQIVAVAAPGTLDAAGARVIDAAGKIVLPGGIQLDGWQVEWQAPDMDLIVCELVLGRRVVPVERRLFHRCSIRPGEDCQDNGSESNKGTF